jgi:PAT family beta-lactamase induction signal transducer AmpG
VASDGFYLLVLDQQSFFLESEVHLQTFYAYRNVDRCYCWLSRTEYDKQQAWSYTMIVVGLIMTLITVYNYFSTQNRSK